MEFHSTPLWIFLAIASCAIVGVMSFDATENCYDSFQCVQELIRTTDLICGGYGSCLETNSKSTSSLVCAAAMSCSQSSTWMSFSASASIGGFLAAAFGTRLVSVKSDNSIAAQGEGSLYGIQNVSLGYGTLSCHGFRSCDSTVISHVSTLQGYGTLSLRNSVTYSSAASVLNITLSGLYAGYNATLYCQDGHECNLECNGNACDGTYFICEEGSICNVTCADEASCPLSNKSEELEQLELALDHEYDMILKLDDYNEMYGIDDENLQTVKCGAGNATSCNDYQECYGATYLYQTQALCCQGYYACESGVLVMQDAPFYCTARYGAEAAIVLQPSAAYITGVRCLQSGIMSTFGTMVVKSQRGATGATMQYGQYLTCDGFRACYQSIIKAVSNIYGTGRDSLKSAYIATNGIDISLYLVGYEAARDATIVCSQPDDVVTIYCVHEGCSGLDATLYNRTCYNIIRSDTMLPSPAPSPAPTEPTIAPTYAPTDNNSYSDTSGDSPTTGTNGNYSLSTFIDDNLWIILPIVLISVSFLLVAVSYRMHEKKHSDTITFYSQHYQRALLSNGDFSGSVSNSPKSLQILKSPNSAGTSASASASSASSPRARRHSTAMLDYATGMQTHASHFTILVVVLTIYDVMTDIAYVSAIGNCGAQLQPYMFAFLVLVLAEVGMNIYFMRKMYLVESKRWQVTAFVKEHVWTVVCVAAVSVFEVKLLVNVLTSQMFGSEKFYAPFLRSTVSQVNKNNAIVIPCHLAQFGLQAMVFLLQSECDVSEFGLSSIAVTLADLVLACLSYVAWKYVHTAHVNEAKAEKENQDEVL